MSSGWSPSAPVVLTEIHGQDNDHRSPAATKAVLAEQYSLAKQLRKKAELDRLRTASGVKDTFLDHFIHKLQQSHFKMHGDQAKKALEKAISELPDFDEDAMSPIWKIQGMSGLTPSFAQTD